MGLTIPIAQADRFCRNCFTKKSYQNRWLRSKFGILCLKCHNKLVTHPKWNHITNKYRFSFTPKGRIWIGFNPRVGVCTLCRAVVPWDAEKTAMHHDDDRYDINEPLKYTMEVCTSCHRKIHGNDPNFI